MLLLHSTFYLEIQEIGKKRKFTRYSFRNSRNTTRSDFKFYADRLIRLVIEESLNNLPFTDCEVVTPTGALYKGLKYGAGNCGVSIVRSGEAMEQVGIFNSNMLP